MRKLFMAIFLALFFAVWIGSGLILNAYEYGWISCTALGFVIAAVVDWLATHSIFALIKFAPIIIQKPFYLAWKENLITINAKADPLFCYPMAAFLELELDKHFEEGGIKGAEKALHNRIQNVGKALLKPIEDALAKLEKQ